MKNLNFYIFCFASGKNNYTFEIHLYKYFI